MARHPRHLLGQLMLDHGLIKQAQLDEALARQHSTFKYIGEILIDMGAISRRDLTRMLELQHKLSRDSG